MLEFDMIDAVAGRMVTSMYKTLKNEHEYAMNEGVTESAADEAARIAIEKLFFAMKKANKELRNEHEYAMSDDKAVRMAIEKRYHTMNIKNSFSGSRNFKKISSEIVHESLSIDRDVDAVVYAKNDNDDTNIFVVGNIGVMINLITDMIILISEKSGASIPAILLTISTLINDERSKLR